jgi:hypothetical protein
MIHERTNSTDGFRAAVLLSAIILGAAPAFAQDFRFDGSMSRSVLENYLDRSISFTELLHAPLRLPLVPPADRRGPRDHPRDGVLQVGNADAIFLKSRGGVSPSGWSCEHLPYLVEFDNFGRSNPGKPSKSPFIWGWDEITWFALQPEAQRNQWLRYAWKWVKQTDPNGQLQMPGSRVMSPGKPDAPRWYCANMRSDACPQGFNTEDTIKDLWGTR